MIQLMKNYILVFLLVITISSCSNAWNEGSNKTFHKACIDEARTWSGSAANAEVYCNCLIVKVKEKYPNEDDAIKNIGSLSTDKDLQICKDSLTMK